MSGGLTDVVGLQVGHWTHEEGNTGCTVVLAPAGGCTGSGLVLGGAPATREAALLSPEKTVARIDALLLTGGSAFGLAAADGVVRWLAERGRGFATGGGPVPIVPAAALYDLESGSAHRPGPEAGYAAASAAGAGDVPQGRVGAGAGARVASYFGPARAVPSGVGTASVRLDGTVVAALTVSNALGDIYDPRDGRLAAGHGAEAAVIAAGLSGFSGRQNTTLAVVATDAPLSKGEAAALAVAAHAGIARAIRPSHTPFDGDTVFVLSTASGPARPPAALAVLAQQVVTEAVLAGARAARQHEASRR